MMQNNALSPKQLRYSTLVMLLTLVLFAMTSNVVFGSIGRVSETFGVPAELFSMAVSVQFIGYYVTCLLMGILSDRFGKKRMLAGACIAAFLGAFGWAIAPSIAGQVADFLKLFKSNASAESVAIASVGTGALLLGAGGGILEGLGSAVIVDLHPNESKYYMNLSQMAYCVGAILPTVIIAKLYPLGISWRWAFTAVALSSLAMTAAILVMSMPENSLGRQEHGNLKSTLRILPSVAVPSICQFCYVLAETGMVTYIGIFLKDHMNAPESMSIYGLPIFWGTVIAGRIACAYLPQNQRFEWIIIALMLCSGIAIACQSFISSWQLSMLLFAVTGLAFSGIWPLIVSLAASRNLEDSGAATGITISTGALGCIVAPMTMGPLLHGGHVVAAFIGLAGLLAVGAMLMSISALRRNR